MHATHRHLDSIVYARRDLKGLLGLYAEQAKHILPPVELDALWDDIVSAGNGASETGGRSAVELVELARLVGGARVWLDRLSSALEATEQLLGQAAKAVDKERDEALGYVPPARLRELGLAPAELAEQEHEAP